MCYGLYYLTKHIQTEVENHRFQSPLYTDTKYDKVKNKSSYPFERDYRDESGSSGSRASFLTFKIYIRR